jgi:DNA polymerase (family 10)
VIEAFTAAPGVRRVVARGRTRATVRLQSGLQVDLRVLDDDSYGAGLYYFTGSKTHNIAVRGLARASGLKINEYGVFRGTTRIAGETEEGVLRAVGLPWIAPELREARGEIEAARAGALPDLLELGDLRGDLHMHTTDSDGRDGLDEMAEAAEGMGYEYLAITDHTPAVRVVGGLDRAGFLRQMRRIDRLNARLRKLTVLKGAEVDILGDGTIDLDDATLSALDIVLVSIHSKFTLSPAMQTARIVRALRHPSVDVLAHPTARLINGRAAVRLNFDEVCRVAAAEGRMLEINAQPQRLDLDDLNARAAVALGVTLTLGTDAHAVAELAFMKWGVMQARRGWVTESDVLNTRPLRALLKRLHGER